MSVNIVYGSGKKPRKPKISKQSEDSIIKDARYLFRLKTIKQSKIEKLEIFKTFLTMKKIFKNQW